MAYVWVYSLDGGREITAGAAIDVVGADVGIAIPGDVSSVLSEGMGIGIGVPFGVGNAEHRIRFIS